jgi:hypothetical protein
LCWIPLQHFEFLFCPVNRSWQQYLTANSDRLSHFGRRMSLFLQTLVLRGIWSSEQEHRQEHVNLAAEAQPGGAENGSRFAGAAESKNAALRPAFGVTSSTSRLVT